MARLHGADPARFAGGGAGELEVASAMFGMVTHCANEMLAKGAAAARRSYHELVRGNAD